MNWNDYISKDDGLETSWRVRGYLVTWYKHSLAMDINWDNEGYAIIMERDSDLITCLGKAEDWLKEHDFEFFLYGLE